MKPLFVIPSVQHVKYRGDIMENSPVNLSMCLTFAKGKYNRYPDNEGIPTIDFYMTGDTKLSWLYLNKETRDAEYKDLLERGE
jgi:hypothetical protein